MRTGVLAKARTPVRGDGSEDALVNEYASPDERAALKSELDTAEEWLYEHEDEVAKTYTERLKVLKDKVDVFAKRKNEAESALEKAQYNMI